MTSRKPTPSPRSHRREGARLINFWANDEERSELLAAMEKDGHKHLGPWLLWVGLQRARSGRTTP